jgi:magnesium transporter
MDEEDKKSSKKEKTEDGTEGKKTVEGTGPKVTANGNGEVPCDPFVKVSDLKEPDGEAGGTGKTPAEGDKSKKASDEPPTADSRVRPYYPDQVCESALRSFMVALRPYQAPLKLQADDPVEFLPFLKDTTLAWINFRVKDLDRDAPAVAKSLGFNAAMVEAIVKNKHSGYEDHENEMGLMLPAIRVDKLKVRAYHFLILIKDSLVFTIHGEEVVRLVKFARYAETYMRKIPVNIPMKDKLTMLLERIIDENNERNFDGIRTIEEESDEVGKMLSDPKTPMVKLSPIIYEMKHALISYLNLLWDTQNVIHSLRYGDPELLSDDPDILEKFEVLGEDVTRHIQLGENLSEVLASGLEVLQGIYNNQLQIINNKMALVLTWMTILGTALLVPNTIATALGNTAYALKTSDAWWYSGLLIMSTILSTVLCWYLLKRKGLLPKEIE